RRLRQPGARPHRHAARGGYRAGRLRRLHGRSRELALLRRRDRLQIRAGRAAAGHIKEVAVDWHTRGVGLRIGAHGGDPEFAPENTLAAFDAAVALGVDYVETDVQRTADGVLVLLHDDDLDRTTNGTGPVALASSHEVLALDAGSWFDPKFSDQR